MVHSQIARNILNCCAKVNSFTNNYQNQNLNMYTYSMWNIFEKILVIPSFVYKTVHIYHVYLLDAVLLFSIDSWAIVTSWYIIDLLLLLCVSKCLHRKTALKSCVEPMALDSKALFKRVTNIMLSLR